jgi:hypothetical protein
LTESEIVIESVAILIGDYATYRKQAALLILKAILPSEFVRKLLEDDTLYPFDRNDPRVKEWTKAVISRGECERCQSTERLEAHHIIKWADYPQGRINVNNGACLCHNCHTEQHTNDASYYMMKAR